MQVSVLSGYVGSVSDPVTTTNSKVLNFTMAENRKIKKGDEKVEELIWYNCSLWEKEAIYPYIKKGEKLTVRGRISTNLYLDKDGKPHANLLFNVDEVDL